MSSAILRHRLHLTLAAILTLLATLIAMSTHEAPAARPASRGQDPCSCFGDPVPAKCAQLCDFGLIVTVDGQQYCLPPCEWFGSQGRIPTRADFETYYDDPDCFSNLSEECKDAIITEWTRAVIQCCGLWDWENLGCNFDDEGGVDCDDLKLFIEQMDELKYHEGCPDSHLTRDEIIRLVCCFLAQCAGSAGGWEDYCDFDAAALQACINDIFGWEMYEYDEIEGQEWEDFLEKCSECCCIETGENSGLWYSNCGDFDCDQNGDTNIDCDDIRQFLDNAAQCTWRMEGRMLDADDVVELICLFLSLCPEAFDCGDLQALLDCACEWLGRSLTQAQAEMIAQCIDEGCHADLCHELDEHLNYYNGDVSGEGFKCDLNCDGQIDCDDLKEFIRLSEACNEGGFSGREQILQLICKFLEECEDGTDLCAQLLACMEDIFREHLGEEHAQVTQADIDWLLDPENCDFPCEFNLNGPGTQDDPICSTDCDGVTQCTHGDSRSVNVFGHKIENIPVLSIPVNGGSFPLTIEYSSKPGYDGSNYLGFRMTGSPFRFVRYDEPGETFAQDGYAPGTIFQTGVPDYITGPHSWKLHGPTTESLDRTTATFLLDSDAYAVWRVSDPGRETRDFYREPEMGESVEAIDNALIGLPLQATDEYGNTRTYSYLVFPKVGGGTVARLSNIRFWPRGADPSMDRPDAELRFRWIFGGHADVIGRLREAYVVRYDGATPVITQRALFTYMGDNGAFSTHLGIPGDLVQMTVWTRVDRDLTTGSSTNAWRAQVTQFRYHGGASPGGGSLNYGTFSGIAHQLKMLILPEQIEYAAQKHFAGTSMTGSVTGYAASLLMLQDQQIAFVEDFGSGPEPMTVAAMAAKVISEYDNTHWKVKTQFIQSSCGCGGGGTQGLKLTYDHFIHGAPPTDWTMRVREWKDDGTGDYEPHRVLFYDSKLLPASGTEQAMPFLVNIAVLDDTDEDGVVDGGEDVWVTHYAYDADRNLIEQHTPAAMDTYTDGTSSAATYAAKTGDGLIVVSSYTTENRRETTSIKKGSSGTAIKLSTITYDGTKKWLPIKVERFRTDDNPGAADQIEVTEFTYGFHTSGSTTTDIAWITTTVEAELQAENGPGGTYASHELFDALGNNTYSISADGAITKRFYDAKTGRLTKVVRNAANDLPNPYHGLTTTGFGRHGDGGSLTTEYTRDVLGRVVERISPGLVSTYTMREMREWPQRPGVAYYAETTLPHLIDAMSNEYDGPVSITWSNADDGVIGASDHTIGVGGYTFDTGRLIDWDESGGIEIARSAVRHDLSGLARAAVRWHDVADDRSDESTFEYDTLGRLEFSTDPLGTITRQTYDILDRVVSEEVGTSTMNLVVVAEYFHDSAGTTTPGVGNGDLTLVRQHVDDSNVRDTVFTYDWRDRLIKETGALPPNRFIVYDNLDRVVEEALFETTGNDWDTLTDIDDSGTRSERGLYKRIGYSQRGLVFAESIAIDPTVAVGSMTFLGSHRWHDAPGRVVGSLVPSGPMTKTTFDGLGRPTISFITDRGGDALPGASGNYADVHDSSTHQSKVNGDVVLEQRHYRYIDGSTPGDHAGMLDLVTTRRRAHDASDSIDTGSLAALASTKSIITYTATFFDGGDRVIRSVNYGTNQSGFTHGGSAPTINQASPPDWNSGGDQLVTETAYNARGLVETATDPTGKVTKYFHDDLGRTIAVAENFDDATVTWDDGDDCWEVGGLDDSEPSTDRVTSLVYDGAGNVVKQVAHHPVNGTDEARQVTEYTYGVTKGAGAGDSRLHHNGLLFEVAYPDSADADDVVRYAWNRLGETRWLRDQNGSTHTYTRDELGRVTLDKGVKPGMGPGAAIDDVFDAISIAYDDFGRVSTVRTLLKSNGSPANGVKFEYTKLWQVEKVWQDVDGASFGGGTPVVEYLYDTAPITNRNFTRMQVQTWPLGQEYETAYIGTANGRISRPDGLRPYPAGFPSDREIAYSYVGLGMTAVVEYEPPDVLLDHHAAHNGVRASGSYAGFDRFGRVTKQHWVDGAFTTHGSLLTVPNIPPIVELDYAYDKASNRLKMLDGRPGAGQSNRDMVYEYDGLHRLGEAKRGVDGGPPVPAPGSEKWSLDMLGNWSKFFTDLNGDGDYLDTDEETRRSHNEVNELLDIDLDADTTPDLALTYDRAGNLRTRELPGAGGGKLHFTYDLWNRLVKIEIEEDEAMGQVGEYEYYGSHWRSIKRLDTDGDRILDEQREQYYSAGWQLIEEWVDDDYQGSPGINRHLQYLWGLRYIDDVIWHREDANGDGDFDDDGDHRWWHLTDAQFSTVAIVDDDGNVAERVRYDAYGKARHHHKFDVDGDGDFDATDYGIVGAIALSVDNGIGQANYRAEADLNRDGVVDIVDLAFMGMGYEAALAPGELSNSTVKNTIGWNGYVFNPETAVIAGEGGMYLVRFRWYGVDLGRWTTRDPAGYVDGSSFYQYAMSAPVDFLDPSGLVVAGGHHPYPLHLGGANCQPCIGLPKDLHNLVHEYFRRNSFGYGNVGRANWAQLSVRQQQAHIIRSLRTVGVPNCVIRSQVHGIMQGASPGVKTIRSGSPRVAFDMRGGQSVSRAGSAATRCSVPSAVRGCAVGALGSMVGFTIIAIQAEIIIKGSAELERLTDENLAKEYDLLNHNSRIHALQMKGRSIGRNFAKGMVFECCGKPFEDASCLQDAEVFIGNYYRIWQSSTGDADRSRESFMDRIFDVLADYAECSRKACDRIVANDPLCCGSYCK